MCVINERQLFVGHTPPHVRSVTSHADLTPFFQPLRYSFLLVEDMLITKLFDTNVTGKNEMSLFEKIKASQDAKDVVGYLACLHDDFVFVRH